VSVALVLSAACTGGGDEGEGATTTGPRPAWCDVLESLDLPEDAPDVDVSAAPLELQVSLQFIAETETGLDDMRKAGNATDAEAAGAVEARTKVEAWGHEHCGTPDPFCSLWVSLEGLVEAGPTRVPMDFVVDTLDDRLIQYAPDEHIDAVKDYLVQLYASIHRPVPSDWHPHDGEVAKQTLDRWVDARCSVR
jgi:hypothetical protein